MSKIIEQINRVIEINIMKEWLEIITELEKEANND